MDDKLETRIKKIIDSSFETPSILKKVLADELALLKRDQQNTDILGLIYIEPTFIFTPEKNERYSGAFMLLATTAGLINVEEGLTETEVNFGGCRTRFFPYYKIVSVELDSCLLRGVFKIVLGGTEDSNLVIEFDAARNLSEFQEIIRIIREKMTDIDRHMTK